MTRRCKNLLCKNSCSCCTKSFTFCTSCNGDFELSKIQNSTASLYIYAFIYVGYTEKQFIEKQDALSAVSCSLREILQLFLGVPAATVGGTGTPWHTRGYAPGEQSGTQQHNKGPLTYRVFCALKFIISNVDARYARS